MIEKIIIFNFILLIIFFLLLTINIVTEENIRVERVDCYDKNDNRIDGLDCYKNISCGILTKLVYTKLLNNNYCTIEEKGILKLNNGK